MTVDRENVKADDRPIMSIHFTATDAKQTSDSATSGAAPTDSTTSTSTPSEHDPVERVETIDMKGLNNSEILQKLVSMTKAYPVEPTAQDREEMQILADQEERGRKDAQLDREVKAKKAKEAELLQQARRMADVPTTAV